MSLHITSNIKSSSVRVKDRDQLRSIIEQELKRQGPDADLNFIDTSEIDNMVGLFIMLNPRNIKIDQWDVSNVENMQDMFWNCTEFSCDLSEWSVSKVINMGSMFSGCTRFNSDLSNWCVSSVADMTFMFNGCKNFNCDLSGWKLSDDFHSAAFMFNGCESFNKKNKPKDIILNNYDSPVSIPDIINDELVDIISKSVNKSIAAEIISTCLGVV